MECPSYRALTSLNVDQGERTPPAIPEAQVARFREAAAPPIGMDIFRAASIEITRQGSADIRIVGFRLLGLSNLKAAIARTELKTRRPFLQACESFLFGTGLLLVLAGPVPASPISLCPVGTKKELGK